MTIKDGIAEQLAAERAGLTLTRAQLLAEGRWARTVRNRIAKGEQISTKELARLDRYNGLKSTRGRKPKIQVPRPVDAGTGARAAGAAESSAASSTVATPTVPASPEAVAPKAPEAVAPKAPEAPETPIKPVAAKTPPAVDLDKKAPAKTLTPAELILPMLKGTPEMFRDWLTVAHKEIGEAGKTRMPQILIDGMMYNAAGMACSAVADWIAKQGIDSPTLALGVVAAGTGFTIMQKRGIKKAKKESTKPVETKEEKKAAAEEKAREPSKANGAQSTAPNRRSGSESAMPERGGSL